MGSSFKHESIVNQSPRFQRCQIVCLEHDRRCLYAEVIQIVEGRQICWVRPLLLTVAGTEPSMNDALNDASGLEAYYDLRQDADLLWPLDLFRTALDTEVLPLLSRLYANEQATGQVDDTGRRQFRLFVQQVWQAYPDKF